MKIITFLLLILLNSVHAQLLDVNRTEVGMFAGRISSINESSGLIRIKLSFENFKYINNKDRIEFWSELDNVKRCLGFVEARSAEYMLIKVPEYKECVKSVSFTTGSYLKMYSPDLENSIAIGKELVKILLKKRLALDAKKVRLGKELNIHPDKVEAINKRYEILKQKLELEWSRELSMLEEDKTKTFKDYKNTEARLDEIDHKLQIYKIKDENFTQDRWSLDPKLYLKK